MCTIVNFTFYRSLPLPLSPLERLNLEVSGSTQQGLLNSSLARDIRFDALNSFDFPFRTTYIASRRPGETAASDFLITVKWKLR